MRFFLIFFTFLTASLSFLSSQEKNQPETFISHKVKKKETLYSISRLYDLNIEQVMEYNPILSKRGLRKRMILKIPVFKKKELVSEEIPDHKIIIYKVKPKDTKWRIAYNNNITIQELEKMNPVLKKGLQMFRYFLYPSPFTLNLYI